MSLNTNLDELMQKVDSRYTLVVVAAKRARRLTEKKEENNDNGSAARKPVTEALKEISQGNVKYHRIKHGLK